MPRKAKDCTEIRNPGTGVGGKPGLQVGQKGAASIGGKACVERTAGRCSSLKAPEETTKGS